MEKMTLEQAKEKLETRNHNSNIENLANAVRYVTESREELKRQMEDLAELEVAIETAAAETPLNNDLVWELYSKASQKRFDKKR